MESGTRRYQRLVIVFILLGLVLVFLSSLVFFTRGFFLEAYAQLLFIPILFGVIYWGKKGGILSALISGLAYVALFYYLGRPQEPSSALVFISIRFGFFLLMGIVGGIIFDLFRDVIQEIEERVLLNSSVGLFTTRYFITALRKEIDRATRYDKSFSVAIYRVGEPAQYSGSKTSDRKMLRKLAEVFKKEARIVDTMAVCGPAEIGIVLPEVDSQGLKGFIERVNKEIHPLLDSLGVDKQQLEVDEYTYPDEEKGIEELINKYAEVLETSYIKRPREFAKK